MKKAISLFVWVTLAILLSINTNAGISEALSRSIREYSDEGLHDASILIHPRRVDIKDCISIFRCQYKLHTIFSVNEHARWNYLHNA